jgi:hypothetical protein
LAKLPLKIQSLRLGTGWFGVIQASCFAGSLLGYWVFSHWCNKKWGMLPAMVLAAAGIGLGNIARLARARKQNHSALQ